MVANANRRFNTTDKLNINRVSVEDLITIKSEIIDFNQLLYSEPEAWRPDFTHLQCPQINAIEKQWLQRDFEEQEILEGIKACAIEKALGPGGYTMGFFLHCWKIIKEDLMNTFQNFHSQEYFEKSFNATYIALIPKKVGAA